MNWKHNFIRKKLTSINWGGIKYAKSVLRKIKERSDLFLNKGYAKYFCLHNIMDHFTFHQLIMDFFILEGKVKNIVDSSLVKRDTSKK